MITACKTYITDSRTETVWSLDQTVVKKRLRDCIHLNEQYKLHYHMTKEKLEIMPDEHQFDFSEMYIFGKFDTFARRLQKIIEMFETIESFSELPKSKIEGNWWSFVNIALLQCIKQTLSLWWFIAFFSAKLCIDVLTCTMFLHVPLLLQVLMCWATS